MTETDTKNVAFKPEDFVLESEVETKTRDMKAVKPENAESAADNIAANFANSSDGSYQPRPVVRAAVRQAPAKAVSRVVVPTLSSATRLVVKPAVSAVNEAESAKQYQTKIDELLSGLEKDVEAIEGTIYDTRFDLEERKKIGFGRFDEKKDVCFDFNTRLMLSQSNGFVKNLKKNYKISDLGERFENIQNRLDGINIFNETFEDIISTSTKICKNGDKLFDYITPMDMHSCVHTDTIFKKTSNKLKLQAKVRALHKLKNMAESDLKAYEFADGFETFTSKSHEESWHGKILQTIEKELVELDDWDLIGQFKKIMGRMPRGSYEGMIVEPRSGTFVAAVEEKPKVEPRKGFFRSYLGRAAAFVAGVAMGVAGTIGYQNYSAPRNNVVAEVPAVAGNVEREEAKSDYSLDLDRLMDERMPKRTYNSHSLSLEDVTCDERDYSGFELNLK